MRIKDENKSDAIFEATIDLLNEIGFTDISMSKIAKRAGLSSSTIYVYFENKDDMLKKTYLYAKNQMFESMEGLLDERKPVRETIALLMRKFLNYLLENKSYFMFSEQFGNSPLLSKFNLNEQYDIWMSSYYAYFNEAKKKKILRDADTALLIAYCYYPTAYLAKAHFADRRPITEEIIEQTVELSWRAIQA